MKNKIEDLRNHLFATLEALQDKENPMELDRAKAIAQVAQVLVESAKVECDVMKITGATGSSFMPQKQLEQKPEQPGTSDKPRLVSGK